MTRKWRTSLAYSTLCAAVLSLSACSGGDGTTLSSAIEVPAKVDVVSAKSGSAAATATISPAAAASRHVSYMDHIRRLRRIAAASVSDLPEDSDYNTTETAKFVEIKALEVFEIINEIFAAFSQTKYEDNIGDGCYVAKVKWTEECEG